MKKSLDMEEDKDIYIKEEKDDKLFVSSCAIVAEGNGINTRLNLVYTDDAVGKEELHIEDGEIDIKQEEDHVDMYNNETFTVQKELHTEEDMEIYIKQESDQFVVFTDETKIIAEQLYGKGFEEITKEENKDSTREDNLDNTDDESGAPLEDNTLLKEILEREVRIVVERIDLGASARKRTLNQVHQRDTKRVKLDETTQDRHPLTNAVLKIFPKRNRKTLYKSFSKESSVDSDVKSSKNKLNIKLVANRHQGNRISAKVNTVPKHKIQVKNVVAQTSETSTPKVVCNNAENYTFKPCLPKSVDAVALNSHLHKDTLEKPYKCDLCDYRCSRRDCLVNHIKYKHTKEKNFSCHMCQYKCVTKGELSRHLPQHTGEKPYECDLCYYRCSQRGHLERHINNKHTKEKNFSCHMCQYKCVTKGDLSRHLPQHTGEKPYKCDICDYKCSRRDNLKTHIKYKHTKEKNFSCHMCQYKCVTKDKLSRHLPQHTGEKPYLCDLCDNRFSFKCSLNRHILSKHAK